MPKFEIGERVKRIENREITGAVVLEVVVEIELEGFIYYIEYDEGSTGWWTEIHLEKE